MCVVIRLSPVLEGLPGLSGMITSFGVPLAIVVWLVIGIIKLVTEQAPAIITFRQKRGADRDEHQQSLEHRRLRHKELLELTEAGSRTYTEEQLTQHLSEVYVEFQAVNGFIRETVSTRLEEITGQLDQILLDVRDLPPMKERLAEVRMYAKALDDRLNTVAGLLEKLYGETVLEEVVSPEIDESPAS